MCLGMNYLPQIPKGTIFVLIMVKTKSYYFDFFPLHLLWFSENMVSLS